MNSYVLHNDEGVLYDGKVSYVHQKNIVFTLTSERMIFEKYVGFFKKKLKTLDEIPLMYILVYKGKVQIKNKRTKLKIRTIKGKVTIDFISKKDAIIVKEKITSTLTGYGLLERTTNSAKKKAFKGTAILGSVAVISALAVKGVKYAKTIFKNGKYVGKGLKDGGKALVQVIRKK